MGTNEIATILSIDDDSIVQKSIVRYLEDYDYHVLEASNGKLGLELFRNRKPDLVLVDLRMPELDGLEVLARVTAESPDTPIIMVSGTGVIQDVVEALRLGAWDYLMKPIEDMAVLGHAVAKALERARFITQSRVYKDFLEHEVARRTAQLQELNADLEDRVRKRTSELESLHEELVANAHRAGMAVIATETIHNIGNILNSVNVSIEEIADILKVSKLKGLSKAGRMLVDNRQNLAHFLSNDRRGSLIPRYIDGCCESIAEEHGLIRHEVNCLADKFSLMRDVITTQQNYATLAHTPNNIQVTDLLEDAIKLQTPGLTRQRIKVERDYRVKPMGPLSRVKMIHVLTNVLKNAREALFENPPERPPQITISLDSEDGRMVEIRITDNGSGIEPVHLGKIFNHGFTTKPTGHGFGLHSCANLLQEIGGHLHVSSAGKDKGATFSIHFPITEGNAERVD